MIKKEKSVSRILWKNYLFMIVASTILVVVPFLLLLVTDNYMQDKLVCNIYTAESIMRDNIENISIDEILENNGGVQVVTKDLQVISLGGINSIKEDKLTGTEWTEFLTNIKKSGDITYTVAFNEKKQFWVIVEFPTALLIQLYFNSNGESVDFGRMMWAIWGIFILYVLLLMVSAIIYSKITARDFVHPIKELCCFVKGMEKEDYKQRMTGSDVYEFKELQDGFYHLATQLDQENHLREEMKENKNRLIRDISHDLKNPLASIQGYAEMYLNQSEISEETKKNYIHIIHSNSVRANELITNLFHYSQIDGSDFELNVDKTDLCELLREKMATLIPVLEEKEFLFEIDIPEKEIFCLLDILQINRVFDNLLDNAVKYNEGGTNLLMKVTEEERSVTVEIYDNGIGIDKKVAQHIFEPFIRVDEVVRNSKNGGSGLGLAIAKRIVQLHKGKIYLETSTGLGCKFIITLNKI